MDGKKSQQVLSKKYPDDVFIIESQYGCYPVGSWCYVTTRRTLDEAIKACLDWGEEYRVVDSNKNVLYPQGNRE